MKTKNYRGGNLDRSEAWHRRNSVYCKVGTIPTSIVYDRRTGLKVGHKLKFRDATRWSNWKWGVITDLEPLKISLL